MKRVNSLCPHRIKALRLMAGLGMKEAAKRLGVKVTHYAKLERGEVQLDAATIELIAALYDIPPDRVCDGPLPVPISYSPPLSFDDDAAELSYLIHEAYHSLWRYRMNFPEKRWEEIERELPFAPPLPPPFPYKKISIPSVGSVEFVLDLPHRLSAASSYRATSAIQGVEKRSKRRLTFKLPAVLPPGWYELRSTYPCSARVTPVIME